MSIEGQIVKNWKRRYFVLELGVLRSYDSKGVYDQHYNEEGEYIGTGNVMIEEDESVHLHNYSVEIREKNRLYISTVVSNPTSTPSPSVRQLKQPQRQGFQVSDHTVVMITFFHNGFCLVRFFSTPL
jgi:hypothetical protein